MIQAMEERAIDHSSCGLSSACYLLAGEEISIPRWIEPVRPHSYLDGLLRLGKSLGKVLWKARGNVTAISGQGIKYQGGEIEYSSEQILGRSLLWIARRQPVLSVTGDTPIANIVATCGCDADPKPILQLSSHCSVLLFANWKGTPAMFQYGRCDRAIAEIRRKARGLEIGASDPRLGSLVPRSLALFTPECGGAVAVEEKKAGVVPQFGWDRMDAILEVWCNQGGAKREPARANLGEELDRISKSLPAFSQFLREAGEKLLRWHAGRKFSGEVTHGDLWLGNVLFEGERVSAVLDWEWARADGLRLVDAIHLLLMSYSEFRNTPVGEFLRQLWSDSVEESELRSRLRTIQSRYGVENEDMKFLTLLLWFDYLGQNVISGRVPRVAWTQNMIAHTIPVIEAWLSRH